MARRKKIIKSDSTELFLEAVQTIPAFPENLELLLTAHGIDEKSMSEIEYFRR